MTKERLTKEGNLSTVCVKCGHRFIVSKDEIEFYRVRGLSLPRHCKVCLRLKHAGGNGNKPIKFIPDIAPFKE